MAHRHVPEPINLDKVFAAGVALNVLYIAAEVIAGVAVNSLALLADASHNLSDVLGLLLAWGALYLARLPSSPRRTYGWRSSTILAALFNAMILLLAVGGIAWESVRRLWEPAEVLPGAMMAVAGVGVLINGLTAVVFLKRRHEDLNVHGVFLHMAADAGISLGVVLAGLGISLSGWTWIDPVLSLVVAGVILLGTWGLLRDSVNLILHAVPAGIDAAEVEAYLCALPGVVAVHDLHIWAMSTTETALTAHLVKPDAGDEDEFLAQTCAELHERFGIAHATLQIERSQEAAACRLIAGH